MSTSTDGREWSVPETEVMAAVESALDADEEAVLATIVGVEGSAYRRPGAKMLVTRESGVGSITAGCVEDTVVELAAAVREDGRPRLETFDLTGDDDVWGLGVGCNGVIDILVEPLDEGYRRVVDAYDAGTDAVVFTVVGGDHPEFAVGDRAYGVGEARPEGWSSWPSDALADAAADRLDRDRSETVTVADEAGSVEVFVDAVTAPPELVVFGTGHDVAPVTELASQVDFRVTVAGFRGADATADRFPAADSVRSLSPAEIRDELRLDAETYAVVMTHNFVDDSIAVDELLRSPVPYVGLMGPTERFEQMTDEWESEGRTVSAAELDRLYTPVGLDLGNGTPYGIAHSIVAEAMAVRNGRSPTHLRDRRASIHGRTDG
ncbi:MAG: XdhC family protein [Haloplanus sp.]